MLVSDFVSIVISKAIVDNILVLNALFDVLKIHTSTFSYN